MKPTKNITAIRLVLQLYAITRPLSTQVAATLFFEKSISEKSFTLNLHIRLTIIRCTNVGVGVSTQV